MKDFTIIVSFPEDYYYRLEKVVRTLDLTTSEDILKFKTFDTFLKRSLILGITDYQTIYDYNVRSLEEYKGEK